MCTLKTLEDVFFVEIARMDKLTAINTLDTFSRHGRYVFHINDLKYLFSDESDRSLKASLKRLIEANILTRAVQGVYVYNRAPRLYLLVPTARAQL